ncbi:MAG: hypothetical protein DCC67_16045 [Planctomycetota bacterium]|nr:MAG: hypothetical protein DCC67_16045 [Planctomycetota bacterium]
MRRCIALCCTATLAVAAPRAPAHDPPAVLPGTQPLVMGQPLDEVMVEGISRYALRALAESPGVRDAAWRIEGGSPARYAQLAEHRRERFRAIIGAVDPRLPAGGFEVVTKLGGDGLIARSASVDVYAVRWPVFAGVHGEGLLLRPRKPPAARVVAIPDAAWTPELFAAVANAPDGPRPIAALLAEAGAEVVVPVLVSREDDCSGSPLVGYTNLPHREFIYRQAFPMGRHIVGYEVAKVQAALDQFERLNQSQGRSLPMGAVGVGEGGMLAFYAAAIDPRMESVLVSGYFEARGSIWKESIYRNVWGLLTEFGDAELAALAAPRRLVVEACAVPEVAGPPPLRAGRRGCAAPGAVITCALANVQSEFDRAKAMYQRQEPAERLSLVVSGDGRGPSGSDAALVAFLDGLGIRLDASPARRGAEAAPTGARADRLHAAAHAA